MKEERGGLRVKEGRNRDYQRKRILYTQKCFSHHPFSYKKQAVYDDCFARGDTCFFIISFDIIQVYSLHNKKKGLCNFLI